MALNNAEMAAAWGGLLDLSPEKVTQLAGLLDQWALGGARLATWSRLATDVTQFNDAAVRMVHDWYGGAADGGPNGDGLYPLMNSEAEVFMLPSPAKIMASVAGLDPKGTLLSVADLPASGAQGDLWIIDGDAWAWSHSASAWVDMGPFQGPRGHSIELRKTATEVQWREVGAAGWLTLMPVSDLVGADGLQISLRVTSTHIQSRLGDGEWTDLIAVSALKGADGRELQMRVTATHIQTRYTGEASWTDFISLAALIGPPGWTAVEATIADGARRVKQIVDWVGGYGAKPPTGQFIGASGWVATAAEATDMRGPGGAGSGDMIGANNLSDLTDKAAARAELEVYSKTESDGALTSLANATSDALGGKQNRLGFTPEDVDKKGASGGYAALGSDGKVPAAQLPAPPAVPTKATAADVRAGTDDTKFPTAKALYDAQVFVGLTDAATVAVDMATGMNFGLALGGNRTLGAPSNVVEGKSGLFRVTQDSTGGRTLSFHTNYRLPKAGLVVDTAPGAVTEFPYRAMAGGILRLFGPTAFAS